MRDIRIFIDLPLSCGQRLRLPANAARHVVRVLRLKAGSPLTVFNGEGGEYESLITWAQGEQVDIEIGAHHAVDRESTRPLLLLQGVARGERMDLIVQKTTELGVTHILPIRCHRSVVQLDNDRAQKRLDHWRSVAIAACEQSGRNRLPKIEPVQSLSDALAWLQRHHDVAMTLRGLLDPQATQGPNAWLRSAAQPSAAVALLIGPEGGLEANEIALAREQGFVGVRLGPRILRTETAALAALAAIQSLAGDYS